MAQYKRKLSKGEKWFYKFKYKTVLYRSEAIYDSKLEAKQAETRLMKEVIDQRKYPDKQKSIYLVEAIEERLDYVNVRKSKTYYKDTKRYLRILLKHLGNIPVESIKKSDIETILLKESEEHNNKNGNGFHAINSMIRCFKALFNYTIDNHDLDIKNPCNKIKLYPIAKKIKYIPPDCDIKAILELCDEQQRRLLEFLRDTGARLNEALSLKGKDITEDTVILYTRKSYNSNLTPRKVPVPGCLKGVAFETDELIFGQWVEQPKFLQRKIKQTGQKLWGYHSLRHRYASLLSKQGKPIFEIMCLLGHSSIKTTQIYLQLLP